MDIIFKSEKKPTIIKDSAITSRVPKETKRKFVEIAKQMDKSQDETFDWLIKQAYPQIIPNKER